MSLTKQRQTVCNHFYNSKIDRGSPRGVVANVLDCNIGSVFELVLLLRSLFERHEPSYLPTYGLNSSTSVLLEGCLWL